MKQNKNWTPAVCAAGVLAAGLCLNVTLSQAQNPATPGPVDPALVEKGISIAPVPLNLNGKDRSKVGYGSYLVNAVGGCNDCHTNPSYAEGGDPFKGQPTKISADKYMGGGQAFGPFISRNITPDATGAVAGGLSNFKQIFKAGQDFKQLHPQISPLLQVMPWPLYTNMADRDVEAIYEFLSSIPCLEGGPGTLANRCVAPALTQASASPKNATAVTRQIDLDGSASTSADGKALKYFWTIPAGYPQAGLQRGDSATPTVQFGTTKGPYAFDLTVTDSKGNTSTDRATVNFSGY